MYLPLAKGMVGVVGRWGMLDETDAYTIHPVKPGAVSITMSGKLRLVKVLLRDGTVYATDKGALSLAHFQCATLQGKLRPEELFVLRAQLMSNYFSSTNPHPSGFGALELLGGDDGGT